jgi:hypothetical protein
MAVPDVTTARNRLAQRRHSRRVPRCPIQPKDEPCSVEVQSRTQSRGSCPSYVGS